MEKLVYVINNNGYVAVIEKSSFATNFGVVNPINPLVLCMRSDLIKYYPPQPTVSQSVELINVRASVESHVAEKLMDVTVLDLLPATSVV